MLQKLGPSPSAQPWGGEQCLDQFVQNIYPNVSEGREEKARRYGLCVGAPDNSSFSMLVIQTDFFTQLKVMGLFNVHSLAVLKIMIVIVNFYLQLIVPKALC